MLRNISFILALAVTALATTADPRMGVWKFVPEKSKYQAGPAPKQQTVRYEPAAEGIRYHSEGINAEGKQIVSTFEAKFDGNLYPVTGSGNWAPVRLKKIDNRTIEARYLREGKLMAISKSEVSEDGRTMTVTTKSSNGRGLVLINVSVYQKQ